MGGPPGPAAAGPAQAGHRGRDAVTQGESIDCIPGLLAGINIARTEPQPSPITIEKYGLTREMVPTEWLRDPAVWDALLHSGRSLQDAPGRPGAHQDQDDLRRGLLKPMAEHDVVVALAGRDPARLHSLKVLVALTTYAMPVEHTVDALDVPGPMRQFLQENDRPHRLL